MELLESERRILSPGCCTEEREKGREGGRKRGGGRELRTMRHAILLFYLKEKKRKKKFFFRQDRSRGENRPRLHRNKTRDKMMNSDRQRTDQRGTGRSLGRRWREKQETPTVDGTGERRGSVSLHHLLTRQLDKLQSVSALCFFCTALLGSVCCRSLGGIKVRSCFCFVVRVCSCSC